MITEDMSLNDVILKNPGAQSILMSFGIGCGILNKNEEETLKEACIEHGVNLEVLLRELNFSRYY